MVRAMVERLEAGPGVSTYAEALAALHNLAGHHLAAVLAVLAAQRLPFSQSPATLPSLRSSVHTWRN